MSLTEGIDPAPPESDLKDKDAYKVSRYLAEIALYDKQTRQWAERRKKILKRYKDERSPREESEVRFNMLWSMVQTLKPALLSRTPKPDIQRRFKDDDPIGRVASDVLERCVSYFVQEDEFLLAMQQVVDDYLLPGRGQCWVRYVPHFKAQEEEITDDEGDEDQSDALQIAYEEVDVDFVHVEDFGHNICRTWEEVWLVWRKAYLTRAECVKRFGRAKGNRIPLDYRQKNTKDDPIDSGTGKATIYELWDKKRGVACWLHKEMPDALDVRDDPLRLDGFFPCPRPLFATIATDSLIPTPDYYQWQDQAVELDSLTGRIASVQKSLKVVGVYDASAQGISRILSEGVENTLIPVESWAMFAEKGGIKGAMDLLPIEDIATALTDMYEVREQVKNDLYEITGIADIIRGQSDPQETMGAQQIKSNFATMRLSDRQQAVQRFIREVVRLMVDVICNHFQLETIKEISGVRLFTQAEKTMAQGAAAPAGANLPPAPMGASGSTPASPQSGPAPSPSLPPEFSTLSPGQFEQMLEDPTWEEVERLIRNDALRCFRIDIETDSTIKADEEADKASRIEFLQAAGGFLQNAFSAGQQAPEAIPLLAGLLMFGVRAFPVGKELEGLFESTLQKLQKRAQNPQAQPNPEMEKVQGQMQLEQAKAQADQQAQQARLQADVQLAREKAQLDMQIEHARIQAKQQSEAAEAQSSMAIDQQENHLEQERQMAKINNEHELAKLRLDNEYRIAIETAHIRAAAQIEAARIAAAQSSGDEAETREAAGENMNGGTA